MPLLGAVSRKVHGSAGPFDIDLPLSGSPGIECRHGGANGIYQVVFRFENALASVGSASVAAGTGIVSSSQIDPADAKNYIVELSGVTNAQTLTIALANVSDTSGNTSRAIAVRMELLHGDSTANRAVNSGDIGQTKAASGAPASVSNFRSDVTANGVINSGDIGLTKAQSGTALPNE